MPKRSRFSPEVRERAVRLVQDHTKEHASPWAAITSIATKIGCAPETLRLWLQRAERDGGQRPGTTTAEEARVKALEREVKELRRANEILRKAAAYFAQAELDRRGT
jgi:transposase